MPQESRTGPLPVERGHKIIIDFLPRFERPFRATFRSSLAHFIAGKFNVGVSAQNLCKPSRILIAEGARRVIGVIVFADRDTLQGIPAAPLPEPANRYFPGHTLFLSTHKSMKSHP